MYLSELYTKAQIDEQVSDTFLIHNGLQEGDALGTMLCNTPLGRS